MSDIDRIDIDRLVIVGASPPGDGGERFVASLEAAIVRRLEASETGDVRQQRDFARLASLDLAGRGMTRSAGVVADAIASRIGSIAPGGGARGTR